MRRPDSGHNAATYNESGWRRLFGGDLFGRQGKLRGGGDQRGGVGAVGVQPGQPVRVPTARRSGQPDEGSQPQPPHVAVGACPEPLVERGEPRRLVPAERRPGCGELLARRGERVGVQVARLGQADKQRADLVPRQRPRRQPYL